MHRHQTNKSVDQLRQKIISNEGEAALYILIDAIAKEVRQNNYSSLAIMDSLLSNISKSNNGYDALKLEKPEIPQERER
jgi:hypothetical protein